MDLVRPSTIAVATGNAVEIANVFATMDGAVKVILRSTRHQIVRNAHVQMISRGVIYQNLMERHTYLLNAAMQESVIAKQGNASASVASLARLAIEEHV